MADLDYVEARYRLGSVVGDRLTPDDPDDEPDTVWCDGGLVRITPLIATGKIVDGTPVPWTGGYKPIECPVDEDGYMTYKGNPFVLLLDLTSPKLNPFVGEDSATYRIEHVGITAEGEPVDFEDFNARIAADTAVGGHCDLTRLAPVTTLASVPVVQGPPGVASVQVVTGNEVRPNTPFVIWIGGATQPVNMVDGDLWFGTT